LSARAELLESQKGKYTLFPTSSPLPIEKEIKSLIESSRFWHF